MSNGSTRLISGPGSLYSGPAARCRFCQEFNTAAACSSSQAFMPDPEAPLPEPGKTPRRRLPKLCAAILLRLFGGHWLPACVCIGKEEARSQEGRGIARSRAEVRGSSLVACRCLK